MKSSRTASPRIQTRMATRKPATIVSIGEVLWDKLPAGPRLGGAPANFAILAARLGNPVAFVSSIGDDELGVETIRALESTPLDLTHLQRSLALPTGTVNVSLEQDGHPHYDIAVPAAWDSIASSEVLTALASQARVVYFGTLAQRSEPTRSTIRSLVHTPVKSCTRVCDLNLRTPFIDLETLHWSIEHAEILKLAQEEEIEVANLFSPSPIEAAPATASLVSTAIRSARTILTAAPQLQMVAVTLGSHGSVLVASGGETHHHPGIEVAVEDTIGAGDAFTAGLIHAYLRNKDLARINTVANLCGSFVAGRQGATPELSPSLLALIESVLQAS